MVVGLAGMLAIRVLAGGQREDGQGSWSPPSFDVLIDGVLIGLSAALGYRTGLLFAISLAPELALLGVTAADALIDRWLPGRPIGTADIGAAITAAGALGWLTAHATAALATAVLGLGASVIIYLIMEELLREAHETDTGAWQVSVLFGCFLPFSSPASPPADPISTTTSIFQYFAIALRGLSVRKRLLEAAKADVLGFIGGPLQRPYLALGDLSGGVGEGAQRG